MRWPTCGREVVADLMTDTFNSDRGKGVALRDVEERVTDLAAGVKEVREATR